MKKRFAIGALVAMFAVSLFALAAWATDAEMYFSSDKNGQNRVTTIQEGDEVWIVVYDPDENIDCDVRDKVWTDVKVMDPKTGAYIVWISYDWDDDEVFPHDYMETTYVPFKGHYPGDSGDMNFDYLEETGADTGLFVSKRSFQVGTRANFNEANQNVHVVDASFRGDADHEGLTWDFQGGSYVYTSDNATGFGYGAREVWTGIGPADRMLALDVAHLLNDVNPGFLPEPLFDEFGVYLLGRFENMDTLVGLYQDQNDETDVALGLLKIIDWEATLSWDQEIYKDGNGSATITVVDADENLNCNEVEYVPVYILVNPGSWNPVTETQGWPSPNSFCTLKATGGVIPTQTGPGTVQIAPIRWYNAYFSGLYNGVDFTWGVDIVNNQPQADGAYFVEYPVAGDDNVTVFDTADPEGFCRVSFYAQETGVNTGVFQLNINSILVDLGFDSLRVRDVLVAYYIDPNDEDDFKLATAYIEEWNHSITSFTDADRNDQEQYWLGRDPIYVQVIDANANVDPCCPEQVVVNLCDPHQEDDWEWFILDETSSNSPVFITMAGIELQAAWDALGVGIGGILGAPTWGGYQLVLDSWTVEAYNEDDIYVRYNDVYYETDGTGLGGIGDQSYQTAAPPMIDRIRVANDISFDVMSIGDTQVYDGQTVQMYFLDRQGNRVSGYVNSDCVFVEVVDPDQDEDQHRRERIDAYWDGMQNLPFGPQALNEFVCDFEPEAVHPANALLGDTNVFGNGDLAKLYVLNPRNGRWAAIDLMENGIATGDFISVTCIDLTSVYTCVPTLGVLPGDTIIAVYQDPSNHSDSAWISIKVGIGGGGTPPAQASSAMFADETGAEVASYTDADTVYVKVVDPSHSGAAVLLDAVEIAGESYDVEPLAGATSDTFITEGLALDLVAGESITATYTDPTDPTDESSDTIQVVASVLDVTGFVVSPNPFDDEATFSYEGTGVAATFIVSVYNVAGELVWSAEEENVTEVTWNAAGAAKGAYIYAITVADDTNVFEAKDVLVKK